MTGTRQIADGRRGRARLGNTAQRLLTGAALAFVLAAWPATTAHAQSGLERAKDTAQQFGSDHVFSGSEMSPELMDYEAEAAREFEGELVGTPIPHPTVTPIVVGGEGKNGWYRTPVYLFWIAELGDPETRRDALRTDGCGWKFILHDSGATYQCTADDTSHCCILRTVATVTVKKDTVPPVVTVTGVEPGRSYTQAEAPQPQCVTSEQANVEEGRSGVAVPATMTIHGGPVGGITVTCEGAEDVAGNPQSAPVGVTYHVTPSPPTVTPQVVGTLGGSGWYTSDVDLSWQVAGHEVTRTGCEDVAVVADQAETTYSCTASNTAGEVTKTVSIKRDTRAPAVTVTGVEDGGVYAEGAVPEIDCETAMEFFGESGTAMHAVLSIRGGPLGPHVATCAGATDIAGNASPATSVTYKVLAPPSVTPHVEGTLGRDGWYVGDVSLVWTTKGSELSVEGCGDVTVDTDQPETTYTCTATNAVGSDTATVSIKRDSRGPHVEVTGVEDGAAYTEGHVPAIGCRTEPEPEAESGTVRDAVLTVSGGPFGNITATCAGAEDRAGNTAAASVTYQVHYPFAGFFAPVNPDTLNVARAGRAIPVKFSLSGYRGLDILAAGTPSSRQIACDADLPQDTIEEPASPDASRLTYDAVSDRYVYVWKTSDAWADTCRRLTISLTDGSHHSAVFQLR